jgi:hypothetical protein
MHCRVFFSRMGKLVTLLATLACLPFTVPVAFGTPDFLNKRTFVSASGDMIWEVFPDDADPNVFHRLPDGFEVIRDDGRRSVEARDLGQRGYELTFAWGARDWTSESEALRAAIRATTGTDAILSIAYPKILRMEPDPDLRDVYDARVETLGMEGNLIPGSRLLTRILVPTAKATAFRRRLVQGNGFANRLDFQLDFDDGLAGGTKTPHPFTLSFFLGGLTSCDVIAGLHCGAKP